MSFKLSPEQMRDFGFNPNDMTYLEIADKASAHTAWAIVDKLEKLVLKYHNDNSHEGLLLADNAIRKYLQAEGIQQPDRKGDTDDSNL